MDNLKDFLREGAFGLFPFCLFVSSNRLLPGSEKFVQDLFDTVSSKSYLPNHVPPSSNPPNTQLIGTVPLDPPTGPSFNPPTGPAAGVNGRFMNFGQTGGFPELGQINNRKRTFDDREADNGYDIQMVGMTGERAPKQPRYHNRGGARGGNNGMQSPAFAQASLNGMVPQVGLISPQLPVGIPALDPNNPMSALLAMQALLPLLGVPQAQMPGALGNMSNRGKGKRCRDYDQKGFCARGSSCPYEHGTDSIVVPTGMGGNEASPFNQMLPVPFAQGTFPMSNGSHSGSPHDSSRRSRHGRSGGRTSFSAKGKNYDKSITTIVVENIPEEYFTEEEVREFFSQFGNILEIDMQPYKRLALVKYEDYYSAQRAHASPKTIFENRFVKVFWYKPDQASHQLKRAKSDAQTPTRQSTTSHASAEPEIDPAEIEKRIAEAQKTHEEKQRKQLEAKAQKEELEAKLADQASARRKLLEVIVEKERKRNNGVSETEASLKEADESEALKAKLAMLEAEAQSLGIDPNDAYGAMDGSQSGFAPRGRGRGGYRGRGYTPRGRGSYRGWGYPPRGALSSGGVMRLDNRPKKVAVIGVSAGTPQDEELRQYLFVSVIINQRTLWVR
jgi:RNA-binding protein 26